MSTLTSAATLAPAARRPAPPAALARLAAAVARHLRARRAIRHLAELDDRMLADIGLRRAEVGRAVLAGRFDR